MDRQGYWIPREDRTKQPLWYRPQLRQYLHIDAADTINPDQDIYSNGTYAMRIRIASDTTAAELINVYNDVGKVVGALFSSFIVI